MSRHYTSELPDTVNASPATARPVDIPPTLAEYGTTSPETQITGDPSLRALVGSPESISNLPFQPLSEPLMPLATTSSLRSVTTLNTQTYPGPSRPSYMRSVTSPPIAPAARGQRTSRIATPDASGGVLNVNKLSPKERKGKGHEWTVFGELMGTNAGADNDNGIRQSTSSSSANLRPGARESLREFVVGRSSHSPGRRPTRSVPSSPVYELRASTLSMVDEPEGTEGVRSEIGTLSDFPDYASETQSTHTISQVQLPESTRSWMSILPTCSPLARNILKCSIAYFIASLFTYSPYLSHFIADITGGDPGERTPSPSGHMIATMYAKLAVRVGYTLLKCYLVLHRAVYFNPAKTIGGMLEADKFCLMGLLYAAVISLGSMSMYWFFEVREGWEWLADGLVILWIGLGMSGMAYMKMWMAKPAFNTGTGSLLTDACLLLTHRITACSMTSIILFVV